MWQDSKFLVRFFTYFSPIERLGLGQVCSKWRDVMYHQPLFWRDVRPVIHCRTIRSWSSSSNSVSSAMSPTMTAAAAPPPTNEISPAQGNASSNQAGDVNSASQATAAATSMLSPTATTISTASSTSPSNLISSPSDASTGGE